MDLDSVDLDSVDLDSVDPDSVDPDSVDRDPVDLDPVDPDSVDRDPVDLDPVDRDMMGLVVPVVADRKHRNRWLRKRWNSIAITMENWIAMNFWSLLARCTDPVDPADLADPKCVARVAPVDRGDRAENGGLDDRSNVGRIRIDRRSGDPTIELLPACR